MANINIGDGGYGFVVDESGNPTSLCGPNYFDIQQDIAQGQSWSGFYTPTPPEGEEPAPQAAHFIPNNCRFSCFKKGTSCENVNEQGLGLRTSISTCPTFAPEYEGEVQVNLAGGTCRITVLDSNGNPLRRGDPDDPENCDGTDTTGSDEAGCDLRYGATLGGLNTEAECAAAFPGDDSDDDSTGLDERQMGKVTQFCTPTSLQKDEPFDQVVLRSTGSSLVSQTESFSVLPATCKPAEIDPTACQNEGGLWIIATLASPDTCQPSNFTCGRADGPPPDRCKVNKGKCECRCDRCGEEGTLLNLGTGNQASYVISSSTNAYECPVTIVE